MSVNPKKLLTTALRDEIGKLRQLQVEAAENLAAFAERESVPLRDLRGIAGNLADVYQGAEKAFQRIVRTTGESMPSGSEWHRELLDQMGREAPHMRPAVIRAETRTLLDPFKNFRHLYRHSYGFEFDWHRMKPLLEDAGDVVAALIADLETFCIWLDQVDRDET